MEELWEVVQPFLMAAPEALPQVPDQPQVAAQEALPQAPAPEEVPQDAIQGEQPLISNQERFAGLKQRRLSHSINLSKEVDHTLLDVEISTQMGVEIKLERALRQQGYSPLSINANRDKIRGFVFYPLGRPLKQSSYTLYNKQVQTDVFQSTPYNRIMKAIKNYELFLD